MKRLLFPRRESFVSSFLVAVLGVSMVQSLVLAQSDGEQPPGDGCGAAGDLYVADSGVQNRVLQYDGITGDFVCEFVSDGSGGLKDPNGVTFGPNGNLFVASSSDAIDAVLEYDGATGDFIGVFASGCELDNPTGLAFGPNGNLFVASHLSDSVIEYDGTTGACVATHCAGIASRAMGLTFDSNGDLFVAAQTANQVLKYDGDTCQVFVSCDDLSWPHDVLFRPNGNLLVANRTGENITEYAGSNGACLGVFADRCGLTQPYGITLRPDGHLFVASVLTHEIIEYDGDGGCVGIFAGHSSDIDIAPTFLEFKSTQPPDCNNNGCPADLNGDGVVDAFDLAELLGNWGECEGE